MSTSSDSQYLNERNRKFGDSLVSSQSVSRDDIRKALELQSSIGIRFESALVRVGAISEDKLLNELSEHYSLPILLDRDLPDARSIYKFLESCKLSIEWFLSKEILAWQKGNESDELQVIGRDIFDPMLPEIFRRFFPDRKVKQNLASTYQLERVLSSLAKEHNVEKLFDDDETRLLRELAEEAPVVEFVNNVIAQAVDADASDIHIEPGETEFTVRFRVDGVLQEKMLQPIDRFAAVSSR